MTSKAGSADEAAEAIGLAALVFVTEDGQRLERFLAETGLSPDDLRASAGTREGLAGILDHLLADESLLMVFVASASLDPAAIAPARDMLAGGSDAKQFASTNYTSGHASGRAQARRPSKRWVGPGA